MPFPANPAAAAMMPFMKTRTPPSTWFVSRHAGAIAWARQQNLPVDHWVSHLDLENIARNDTVIGTLPVHLAAGVCARGGRYVHLTLDMPETLRGRELSAEELLALQAELREYRVIPAPYSSDSDPQLAHETKE